MIHETHLNEGSRDRAVIASMKYIILSIQVPKIISIDLKIDKVTYHMGNKKNCLMSFIKVKSKLRPAKKKIGLPFGKIYSSLIIEKLVRIFILIHGLYLFDEPILTSHFFRIVFGFYFATQFGFTILLDFFPVGSLFFAFYNVEKQKI